MQVIISIAGSDRPRQNKWVSATGNYAEVTRDLMRHARRDMNLSPEEDAEIEALVLTWTPSDGFPLPKDEDHTRMFRCNGFSIVMTSRSEERMEMITQEINQLFAAPDFSNHNPDAPL